MTDSTIIIDGISYRYSELFFICFFLTVLLALVVIRIILSISVFRYNLNYVNTEIKRTMGINQEHWKRIRFQVYIDLLHLRI